MSENTHNKIKNSNSGIKKLFFGLIALTMVMTGLTAYSIVQEQNSNAKNSFAAALYTCSSSETLSGQNCLSERLSSPKYELKCKDGYTLMDTSCVKFDAKPCNFFSKGVDAENGFCKFDNVTIYGGEILDYDGRECNGNGYTFYRYNVGLSFTDTTGPIVCASTYSNILGSSKFRWMPKSIKEISNLETIQTGTQYSNCPTGYSESGVSLCSRVATIKSCSSGEIPNRMGSASNIFDNIKATAMESEIVFNNDPTPIEVDYSLPVFESPKYSYSNDPLLDFEYLSFGDSVKVEAATPETSNTIVDIAFGNPNFATLVAALKAADLVTTLQGAGPFTVVAPTNEAFANLPPGVLTALLKPENKSVLTKILTYHVIPGKNPASIILTLNGKSVPTVEGSGINVAVNNGKITLNGSTNVTTADIFATNGVVHVIDKVLLPADLNIEPLLNNSSAAPYNPDAACKPCPPNFYCSLSATDSVLLSCGAGSTLVSTKCKAPVKVSKTTYSDGCGTGYVKYDLTCAVEQFRDRDIDVCSYYFASNNIFITAVTEANGQCSTGGRTDFESTNIFKVSDLNCAGPGSGWYNYNVAYDPLVCGYNTYNPNDKAAFRWSAKSFTKITGLQKIATQTLVCPIGWTDAGEGNNNCVQDPIGASFSSQTPCPTGSFSPANSTSLSACITPAVVLSSSVVSSSSLVSSSPTPASSSVISSSSLAISTSSPKPSSSSLSSVSQIVLLSSSTSIAPSSSSAIPSVVSSSSPTPISSSLPSSSSSAAIVCRIFGKTYLDPNQNGTQDSNEADGSLPAGIVATLKKENTIVLTATPDANGNYIFENIPCNAGVHTITITAPTTYTISNSTQNGEGTGSNPTTLNINSTTAKTFDAGKDGIYLTPIGGVITITNQSSSSSSSSNISSSSSSVSSANVCTSAQPGYYISGAICVICPAGYYCVGNKEPLKICPIGTYCPEGSITPTLCPAGKTTASEGSKSIEACITIALVAASNPTTTITTTRSGGLATLSLLFALATAITGAYAYYDSHMKKGVHAGWNKLK